MENKNSEEKTPHYDHDVYYDGRGTTCPVCGGKIIHPYTGLVTSEQLDEESKCCTWGEVIDEGDSTIGFIPQCKRIHPYTLESEDHKYIHYDLIELANSWDMPLNEKVEKLTTYITSLFKDVEKKDVQFFLNLNEGKISDIKLLKSIKNLCIDLSVDEDGKVTITT
jgi:hypothetical protein